MRFKLLRSTLLGVAVGVLAAPVARAKDDTRPESRATDTRAGSGAERMGGQITGPPHAPTVVGQSPIPLVSGDPRDEEKKPRHHEDANAPGRPDPNQPGSDLKPESEPGK